MYIYNYFFVLPIYKSYVNCDIYLLSPIKIIIQSEPARHIKWALSRKTHKYDSGVMS